MDVNDKWIEQIMKNLEQVYFPESVLSKCETKVKERINKVNNRDLEPPSVKFNLDTDFHRDLDRWRYFAT